jgi:hypothetical protein
MGTDKKAATTKLQSKTRAPDSLTKTGKNGDIELAEKELARATGGCTQKGRET